MEFNNVIFINYEKRNDFELLFRAVTSNRQTEVLHSQSRSQEKALGTRLLYSFIFFRFSVLLYFFLKGERKPLRSSKNLKQIKLP